MQKALDRKEKALLAIFLICMIPNIFVYGYHANHELTEANEHIGDPVLDHKGKEQFAEGVFFSVIAAGYTFATAALLIAPYNPIPYYIIFFGTIAIILIYYASKTSGFPAPDGYDNWIVDDTTNWKDNVTKIAQQIFVIPLALLMSRLAYKEELVQTMRNGGECERDNG